MKGLAFSEPMMKAYLEGRKPVTRRLMKPQPDFIASKKKQGKPDIPVQIIDSEFKEIKPRYLPGETVYIKETWRVGAWDEDEGKMCIDYKVGGFCRKEWLLVPNKDIFDKLWDQSLNDAEKILGQQDYYNWEPGASPCRWRSPRFMPAWASRSHALIVSVRPERIQEITAEEAIKEGCDNSLAQIMADGDSGLEFAFITNKRFLFEYLWESLHPGSWERNDFVFRYELKKMD